MEGRQLGIITGLIPFPTSTSSAHSTSTSISTSATSATSSSLTSTSSISHPTLTLTSSSGGQTSTGINPSTPPSSTGTPTTFLQNKVLSGAVFGLVGLVGLILLVAIAICAIRRSRKKKLIQEAMIFEPVKFESGSMEKLASAGHYMHPTTAPHGGASSDRHQLDRRYFTSHSVGTLPFDHSLVLA